MFDRDTVVIYDLEWTSWPGFLDSNWTLPGKHREILQIGAVRLDVAAGFAELAAVDILVRPRINSDLSPFIIDLTGLTQDRIDRDGVPFADALTGFSAFVGDAEIASWGPDGDVIAENCDLAGLARPPWFARGRDIRTPVSTHFGFAGPQVASSDLPNRLGLAVEGRAHDALFDARCVAAALARLRAQGTI
jgi:inhibitor of KinA sporulation pathway (predicted exonuclease)